MPTYVGYTPAKHQRAVHKCIEKHPKGCVFVICSPRQSGKSTLIINEILRCSINNKDAVSLSISLTLDAARKLYRDIVKAVEGSGVVSKKNDTLLSLEFINGSIVYFRSGEQRDSLRGITLKNGGMLFVDEAAYQLDEMFFGVLLPMTNVYKANIVLTSTPRFKQGFFFKYYAQGKEGSPNIFAFNFADYDLSAFLSPEQKEAYKNVMPRNQYLTEIEGEFLDGTSVLFEGFRETISNIPGENTSQKYMGIDWGSGQGEDRTAISIINSRGQQIFSKAFNDLNTTQTIDEIERIWKAQEKPQIMAEKNGIGKPFCDLLTARKIQVIEWVTSNQSKNDLVKHLQVAFEQKTITLLPDERQEAELSYYQAEYNQKTGNVSYSAPRGLHDDTVIALMLSWEGYLQRVTRCVYSFGKA